MTTGRINQVTSPNRRPGGRQRTWPPRAKAHVHARSWSFRHAVFSIEPTASASSAVPPGGSSKRDKHRRSRRLVQRSHTSRARSPRPRETEVTALAEDYPRPAPLDGAPGRSAPPISYQETGLAIGKKPAHLLQHRATSQTDAPGPIEPTRTQSNKSEAQVASFPQAGTSRYAGPSTAQSRDLSRSHFSKAQASPKQAGTGESSTESYRRASIARNPPHPAPEHHRHLMNRARGPANSFE